jgi:hypothetical protein
MNADDLQELYKLLRGSRAAMLVLDVRTLFLEKQMIKAHALLLESRELYAESRTRLLRQDPDAQTKAKGKEAERQAKRLKRKQEKTREILKAFDELAEHLEKFAEREKQKQESTTARTVEIEEPGTDQRGPDTSGVADSFEPAEDAAETIVARPSDVSDDFAVAFRSAGGDEQLEVISRHFGFQEVTSAEDIHSNALYYIRTSDKSFLVRTLKSSRPAELVTLAGVIDDQSMKPLSRDAFVRLGKQRKMVLLTTRDRADQSTSNSAHHESSGEADSADTNSGQPELVVLDMGAFSQLLTSAQRCGLVAGADQIAHVRDREFQRGNYDLAFQSIDALYAKFTAGMSTRNQKLIREDADISSGRTKISPKDLLAKRARDRKQTQEVDRARRRFQVVLEGLRVLMNAT